jgi:hypothetical protein
MPRLLALLVLLCACGENTAGFTKETEENSGADGEGLLVLSPESLDFTELDWQAGITQSLTFTATNAGEGNLSIYQVRIADSGGEVFDMDEEADLTLAPGAVRDFLVMATLHEAAAVSGSVQLKTSDAAALDLRYPLSATPKAEDTAP